MYKKDDDRLDAEYAAYLDETCKCDLTDEDCMCLSFDDWFRAMEREYAEDQVI